MKLIWAFHMDGFKQRLNLNIVLKFIENITKIGLCWVKNLDLNSWPQYLSDPDYSTEYDPLNTPSLLFL